MKKLKINLFQILIFLNVSYAQFINSSDPFIRVVRESQNYLSINKRNNDTDNTKLIYNHKLFMNSNLPNFENMDGITLLKGYGSLHSFYIKAKHKNIDLQLEPQFSFNRVFKNSIKAKNADHFSVLNDRSENLSFQEMKNFNLSANIKTLSFGFSNKNMWWGPGIHNSLILSNNSYGFYNYYFETKNNNQIIDSLKYSFKYLVSYPMKNYYNNSYYLTGAFLKINYSKIEFGLGKTIISGGYDNISWSGMDAALVMVSKINILKWDQIVDLYIQYRSEKNGLYIFAEYGFPNRNFNSVNTNIYYDHQLASNIGFRKYGAFNNKNLLIGIEYTRIIQGRYYNIMPTSNWYSNHLYNYHSFREKRWAAHSGADSDDMLLLLGYLDGNNSIVYGINYERHGITYNYPPEIKFESRISISKSLNSILLRIDYESEFYRHYNFVDSNNNVWTENFEFGSIQRTKTLLFSLYYTIF